ncbi:Regulator of rDNA transcription protein 15 [Capsicum baccatum]|uniref:Regulator of rDNA transcription protein 15 n=1 Tax=Capsicum baccatum TaxID=33114 RepID=A0A2G2V0M5_CAPBA|nr:Regulator of rDNA transcription protein 15 [Capsicum baccatum]
MIGRADIEGSKSNVAMNAWLPQDSYPCGNFFDTSTFEFQRSKGSLGHAFTVRIRTGSQNQTSFYPSVPHEISILVDLILGHLRYLLTDVPPQPNSPPDNVFRPDRPAERTLDDKAFGYLKRVIVTPAVYPSLVEFLQFDIQSTGQKSYCVNIRWDHCNALFELNSRSPLVRTSSELVVQRAGSISSSPSTAYVFGTGTPVPSPQSQSFSRSYESILPTSLAYIVPSTRGCSPWRPDAVMSTTGHRRYSVLQIFKGHRERTGYHATCGALPAAKPYLRLSRFQGGQAVKQKRQLFPRLPPTSPDFLTLPRNALSHLNICYYHQDLH